MERKQRKDESIHTLFPFKGKERLEKGGLESLDGKGFEGGHCRPLGRRKDLVNMRRCIATLH